MKLTERADEALNELMEGNRRFREGSPKAYRYSPSDLLHISRNQTPLAGIIACADSRVSPELVFDQPLGSIFASRVPGNVASDSAKWMLDLAVNEFRVPLVMVMGHTGCLAVGQLLDGDKGGAGGLHRFSVLSAVYRAKTKAHDPGEFYLKAVEENVQQTVEHLARDSYSLRASLIDGTTSIVGSVYHMETGEVKILESTLEMYGRC
ncbi:MAG: carbonic anhydrase [Fimbriimonas sp.]|nr:carbonic anhydrase [Fimbriimonas sp.]